MILMTAAVWLLKMHSIPRDSLTITVMHVLKGLTRLQGYDNRCEDGWGREIQVEVKADQTVVLTSFGADGAAGGRGEDRDIVGSFKARGEHGEWNEENCGWIVYPSLR
jgi:hypothetical protein